MRLPVFGSVAALALGVLTVSANAQVVDYMLTGNIPCGNSIYPNATFSLTFSAPEYATAVGDDQRQVTSLPDANLTINGVSQFSSKSVDFGDLAFLAATNVFFINASDAFPVYLTVSPEIYADETLIDDGFWAVQMATFAPQKVTGTVGEFGASPLFAMTFSAVAVPEPNTVLMLGAGLLGTLLVLRRRRRVV